MNISIIQPLVPHYRVPFFNALAAQPGINLLVLSASVAHGVHDAGHVSNLPYLDDRYPWVTLPPFGLFFWQQGLKHVNIGGLGDVLVVCGNIRYLSNYPLMLRARRQGVGIVWWGHGRSRHASVLSELLRNAIMRGVDSVLTYTDEEVKLCIAKGLPPIKLFATNNSLDSVAISRLISEWDTERLAKFRIEQKLDDNPILLYCGRIRPGRRLDLLVYALHSLVEQGELCNLVIIGDGPGQTQIETLARGLNLASRIRWLGAVYNESYLAPWFLSSQAFVYPGPIGLSLIHAFSYGLPVITHSNRKNHGPEIAALEDNVNGLLFRENDADDLANKIRLLLKDKVLWHRLSAGARQTIQKRYNIERMTQGFLAAVNYAAASAAHRSNARNKG